MCQIGNAIREWRLSGGFQPGMYGVGQTVHGSLPPSFPASHKKEKIALDGPSLFPSQSMNLANQPPSSAVKHGPIMGLKSQQHKRVS